MSLTNKKSFKKLWEAIEPHFQQHKSSSVVLTDVEFSIGWNRTTYLLLHLNKTNVFFVVDTDEPAITIFSHERLSVEVYETAVVVQNLLLNTLWPQRNQHAKSVKSD
jgi:hypothetical protein